jgi:hypothetical protein
VGEYAKLLQMVGSHCCKYSREDAHRAEGQQKRTLEEKGDDSMREGDRPFSQWKLEI